MNLDLYPPFLRDTHTRPRLLMCHLTVRESMYLVFLFVSRSLSLPFRCVNTQVKNMIVPISWKVTAAVFLFASVFLLKNFVIDIIAVVSFFFFLLYNPSNKNKRKGLTFGR